MDDLPRFVSPVVSVGSFDGLHRGHRFLLDILKEQAARIGGESTVVTFASHPRRVLDVEQDLKLLTVKEEKIMLLSEIGVANTVILPFDRQFSRMSAQSFVERIIIGKIGAVAMVVGYDHRFGHDRTGNFDFLDRMHRRFGFEVCKAPEFDFDGRKVSLHRNQKRRKARGHGHGRRSARLPLHGSGPQDFRRKGETCLGAQTAAAAGNIPRENIGAGERCRAVRRYHTAVAGYSHAQSGRLYRDILRARSAFFGK
ncbi:MAG: hypothetical protein L6V35_08815 [Alistipes putredinis]|nr:MAG: hypothetical protein L6V35_08815 [Alistipes putredinis]